MKRLVQVPLLALSLAACSSSKQTERPQPPLIEGPTAQQQASTREADEEPEVDVETLPFYAVGPVANVNGVEISAETYNRALQRVTRRLKNIPAPMLSGVKSKTVETLVTDRLIAAELESADVEVSSAEIDETLRRLIATTSSPEEFYEDSKLTEDELRAEIEATLRLKNYFRKSGALSVTDSDIRKHFDKHRKTYDQPEQIRASHILLKVDKNASDDEVAAAEQKAAELVVMARKPDADFAALATTHSEGPTAPRGGDLGYFRRGKMVPAFGKVAWALAPGEVSEPVRTRFGFHVIKVFDHKPAVDAEFDALKERIRDELEAKQLRVAKGQLIGELRGNAEIEEFPDNIQDNPDYEVSR